VTNFCEVTVLELLKLSGEKREKSEINLFLRIKTQNITFILEYLFNHWMKQMILSQVIDESGVEKSIVNGPLVSLHSKNTNNAKSEVRLNS
jgi:hypothetical protein